MTTSVSPLLDRLFDLNKQIIIGFSTPFVISDKDFNKEEIEELRRMHNSMFEEDGLYLIANFIPDGVRPKEIPKL
ncbi:MAG: hypothetical protein ACI4QC_09820 [Thermoguttaceae bacterium]